MQRIRIHHTRNAALRYTSTQDNQKMWERVLRRAGLPVAYSQGFHPQPRIQQACPLPLGMTSRAEFLDFWLVETLDLADIRSRIETALHPGLEIIDLREVPLGGPALQAQVTAITYRLTFSESLPRQRLVQSMNNLLDQETLVQERRGKAYDLRPLIQECALLPDVGDQPPCMHLKLSALPGATGRPEEVLKAFGLDVATVFIERQVIHFREES